MRSPTTAQNLPGGPRNRHEEPQNHPKPSQGGLKTDMRSPRTTPNLPRGASKLPWGAPKPPQTFPGGPRNRQRRRGRVARSGAGPHQGTRGWRGGRSRWRCRRGPRTPPRWSASWRWGGTGQWGRQAGRWRGGRGRGLRGAPPPPRSLLARPSSRWPRPRPMGWGRASPSPPAGWGLRGDIIAGAVRSPPGWVTSPRRGRGKGVTPGARLRAWQPGRRHRPSRVTSSSCPGWCHRVPVAPRRCPAHPPSCPAHRPAPRVSSTQRSSSAGSKGRGSSTRRSKGWPRRTTRRAQANSDVWWATRLAGVPTTSPRGANRPAGGRAVKTPPESRPWNTRNGQKTPPRGNLKPSFTAQEPGNGPKQAVLVPKRKQGRGRGGGDPKTPRFPVRGTKNLSAAQGGPRNCLFCPKKAWKWPQNGTFCPKMGTRG